VVGLIAAAIMGTIVVFMFGGVRGTEIDPNSFATRSFSFYRLPFSKMQISPTWYDQTSTKFEQSILSHLDPQRSRKREWQVTEVSYGTSHELGDSKIMDNLLGVTESNNYGGGSENDWSEWSDANPKIAKQFWPLITEMGLNEAYLIMPEFVEATRSVNSVEEFQNTVVPKLSVLYAELAEDYLEAEEFNRAVTLAELAILHDSKNATAVKIRSDAEQSETKASEGVPTQ